jgi:quercetin dioxygenase-like cupin family protein
MMSETNPSTPKAAYTLAKDLVWFDTMPGEQMAIKIHSKDVGGALAVVEAHVPSLIGPPKHIHQDREETFEILEGTFRFQVGDEEFEVTKGGSVVVPRGVPHGWANVGSETGKITFTFTPGGIEDFFPMISQYSLEDIVEVAKKYDTLIVGAPILVGQN